MQFSLHIAGYLLLSHFYFNHLGEEDFIFTLPKDPPLFTPNMKGLLKGLRYISDMFDEKEPEMQIGHPTDVKHVAHIGIDGPSANKPSWMTEFNSAQELSSDALTNNVQETLLAAGNHESLPPASNEKQKKSRRKASIENGTAVESQSPKGSEKQSRRHRSSKHSMGSPGRESSSHGRRHSSRGTVSESPSQDLPDIPKKSRRKKSKASSGGSDGSSTSSRSKCANSLPDGTELES